MHYNCRLNMVGIARAIWNSSKQQWQLMAPTWWPFEAIWRQRSGQNCADGIKPLPKLVLSKHHQSASAALTSMGPMRPIPHEMLKISICEMTLKNTPWEFLSDGRPYLIASLYTLQLLAPDISPKSLNISGHLQIVRLSATIGPHRANFPAHLFKTTQLVRVMV